MAQTAVKLLIEPILEPLFHVDSYGYRPGKSAKQAVAITRQRCWKYDWLVEFDIKAAFDQIDHGLLLKAVRKHIKENWILRYIERWLTAPFETAQGTRLPRYPAGGSGHAMDAKDNFEFERLIPLCRSDSVLDLRHKK